MTRPATGGNHTGPGGCAVATTPRRGTRMGSGCQLCDWNRGERYPNGQVPATVARIGGFDICERHVALLITIAAEHGQRVEFTAVAA